MSIEKYWQEQRNSFLEQAEALQDDKSLLAHYKTWMEQLKTYAMSQYPHEDHLRQMIALLFYQAMQGAELSLVRGLPTIVFHQAASSPSKAPRIPAFLCHPLVRCAMLAMGMAAALIGGKGTWWCALVFAAAASLEALCMIPRETKKTEATAVAAMRIDVLESVMNKQVRLLDQQIEDLKHLLSDQETCPGAEIDPTVLSLCQNVWSVAHAKYPVETALYMAEKILEQNDAAWAEYSDERRGWFEVLPTRQDSRTIYPAIQKASDHSLILRGQYIESRSR